MNLTIQASIPNKPNWKPKTIWTGDNLPIMRGMNSESVDLIYLDPPFNSNANYAAPVGSEAAGAEFRDTWRLRDIDVEWINLIEEKYPRVYRVIMAAMTDSDKSYLTYMASRLLEMRRVLNMRGSIYLHCDPTMSHSLKLLLDAIFEKGNFRNEIVWSYRRWTASQKKLPRLHDIILCYGEKNAVFNPVLIPNSNPNPSQYVSAKDDSGKTIVKRDSDGKPIKRKVSKTLTVGDVWDIPIISPNGKERLGYPTQKPIALLNRIIEASSNEGAVVFDPFCGCATTLAAADKLNRNWIGIDISPKAVELIIRRIKDQQGLFRDINHRDDIPQRTDLGKLPKYNSSENKNRLYGDQHGNCAGCGTHFEAHHLEVDHIISRKRGGTDHIENLQLLCGHCNKVKGDRGMDYLKVKLQLK